MAATPKTPLAAFANSADDATRESAPVVLDLGKHRRKRIKQLRRGEGELLDEIHGAVAELKAAGTIGASSQPVVIIVREKARKASSLFPF